MIIEFNGLPGCGKTFIKSNLIDSINNKTVKSVGVSDYSSEDSIKLKRIFVKLFRFLLIINPFNINFSMKCIKLYFNTSSEMKFLTKSFYENLVAVSYIIYLYREYKKCKDKILVVDEGIIQVISSVNTVKKIKKTYADDVINDFLSLGNKYLFINCDCNIDLSMERIYKRNRNSTAIDKLKGDILLEYLKEYSLSLDKFRSKVISNKNIHMNISTKLSLNEQIRIIAERIEQMQ